MFGWEVTAFSLAGQGYSLDAKAKTFVNVALTIGMLTFFNIVSTVLIRWSFLPLLPFKLL